MKVKPLSFDINQLPHEKGMILFGISMSKIANEQSPENCLKYIKHLRSKLKKTSGVGLTFLYSDYLYMYTDKGSSQRLRQKYIAQMCSHKNGVLKLLEKDPSWIIPSFSFISWGQLLLSFRHLQKYIGIVHELYQKDRYFQKAVKKDAAGRRLTAGQINFFLEEITVFYLLLKGVISLDNHYIQNHEEWVLNCYPGAPLESEFYLYKHNFLGLFNDKNKYENHQYNLVDRVLIDLCV